MAIKHYGSWGFNPPVQQAADQLNWRDEIPKSLALSAADSVSTLAYGNGRSYGDSCLNSAGKVVDMSRLNKIISFNEENGIICVEAGVTFENMLELITPCGWFLPVSPGTSQVTVGGAIANDVHGKNHHCDGTFGRYVKNFTLIRSTGELHECSPSDNTELFNATIGGLGLTGIISKATIQLLKISSTDMDVYTEEFHGLSEFAKLSNARKNDYQYTVAWIDCAASDDNFARGIFLSANHSTNGHLNTKVRKQLNIPIAFPSWCLNRYSIRLFNALYFNSQKKKSGQTTTQSYQQYFYPLDSITNWNRIYGSKGFYQFQFVVPVSKLDVLESALEIIVKSGMGSFLAVLKEFGQVPSPGLLSFPREGYCLALDFSNRGDSTVALIQQLDELVREAGGAAYPAKDRLMSAESFHSYFPNAAKFKSLLDPAQSSDFWRRANA